jgi:ribonuclease HI
MRVFTDGSCTSNGRKGAKAGYAAWFPDHPAWSTAHRVPDDQDQTNNRAELSAILLAVTTLQDRGEVDCDLVVYSDSEYSINCLTSWLPGWMNKGWKTAAGKDVLHQDLIKDITARLSKFKSHRFVHVKAHTGGLDELSKNNAVVDKMAQDIVNGVVPKPEIPVVVDELFPGCPLRIMGGPTQQKDIVTWMRTSIDTLDKELIDKHLYKAFAEMCKARDVALVRQVISKTPVIRAERGHLQIDTVDKVENDS